MIHQDSVRLISSIIKEMGLDKERYKPKQILGRISSFKKNSLVTVRAISQQCQTYKRQIYMQVDLKLVKIYKTLCRPLL